MAEDDFNMETGHHEKTKDVNTKASKAKDITRDYNSVALSSMKKVAEFIANSKANVNIINHDNNNKKTRRSMMSMPMPRGLGGSTTRSTGPRISQKTTTLSSEQRPRK